MILYVCYYKNEDWCCYVAAPTRGKAKHLFNEWYGDGWYTDVRAQKIKDCPDTPEGVYDGRRNGGARMSCRGFDAVCTTKEARQYFRDKGLSYHDITEGDILSLLMLLNREIKKSNKAGETSVSTMHMSSKIYMKKRTNGTIIKCFLYINSHYFTRREAISFNEDGFIGFAGWADQGNTNPLLRAFLRWCDDLAAAKEAA